MIIVYHVLLSFQSTTLYTTFDEILDDSVPDKPDNKLIDVVGEPLMVSIPTCR